MRKDSTKWVARMVVGAAVALLACKGSKTPDTEKPPDLVVAPDPGPSNPNATPTEVDANPTDPRGPGGEDLAWSSAPLLEGVKAFVDRDSATLSLPVVAGAREYRAFVLEGSVRPGSGAAAPLGVSGAVLHCAGFRQHNLPATPTLELLRELDVTGLKGSKVRVVVEALDRPCPFPGLAGVVHHDVKAEPQDLPRSDWGTHSVFTEAEIRARYGSMVENGHGPAAAMGQPAEPSLPVVLARTTVVLTPTPEATPPVATFFDDFGDDSVQPQRVGDVDEAGRSQYGALYQLPRWSLYTFGNEHTQFFVRRGRLHGVLADVAQNVFGHHLMFPRRTAALSDTAYLHVRFDVASDATNRRYWLLMMCGAPTLGATMDAQGRLMQPIVHESAFMQPDGTNPSVAGWNCLQVFPRDGWPFDLGPDNTRPGSDVRVMVNLPNRAARDSVVNVSPDQYHDPDIAEPGWFRQQAGSGPLIGPMLDDQMLIAPVTHFDFYVRRDRVIMYVNGQQRLCNDFPSVKLTMAEAAIGFEQVLYHSSAEHDELTVDYFDRSGQRYLLQNTPFMDARSWDNMGFQESVAAPSGFQESSCYVHH